MAERKKLVHIHSNVADKQPTPSTLTEGELAVNYASGNEFISLKNTENKVVRVSSDPVIMEWVEKKEVFPTGATVSSNTNNASTMTFQLNQKPGKLSPSSAVGTSFVVDTSKYASTGADVTFRALTANSGLSVNGGNTTIKGGDIALSASNSTTVSGSKTVISGGALGVDLIGGTRGVVVQDNNGIAFEVRGQSNLSGNTNVVGNLTTQKNITTNGSLTVNSGASISGDTSISGNTNIKGTLTANATTINGNLGVTGSSMNIDLDEDAYIYAFDGITLGSNVTVNGSMGVKGAFSVGIGQTGSDRPNVNVNAYGMTLSGYNSHLYAGNSLDIKGAGVHIEATAPVGYAGVDIKSNNGVNISAATNITGNTAIDGTLDVKSGLTKSASWSYGSVSGGTSGSYNGSANKSFTIPKSVEHLSNYSAGTVTLDDDIVIKKDLYVSGSIITTGSSTQQNLNLNYGDVRNASNATYNGTTEKTVAIPKSIDHLTNYDGTSINLTHNVKVSGTISANSAIYSSDVKLKENVSVITDEDITKVKSVQLKSFNLKDDKNKRKVYGVIAQEVEAAKLNELVHVAEDGTKGVDYTSLFILKMAALEAEVKALRDEVLHLNSKIEELKK